MSTATDCPLPPKLPSDSSPAAIQVPFSRPSIEDDDIRAVEEVLRSGWIAYGPHVERLEQALASYVGVPYGVTLNSCTSALEAVLQVSGIRGEVVVPSFTWVAVANAVVNAGAVPVFADIDEATFNLTADSLRTLIGPGTEAVIVPHYGGQPADIAGIKQLCDQHGLLLIEDCAETLGGTRDGIVAGSSGIGCFSFYPTKAITTAMGGAVLSRDAALVAKIRSYATHGLRTSTPVNGSVHRPWERAAEMPGRNLRMPNLLAALGLTQLARLDTLNELRRSAARLYDELLADVPGIVVPSVAPGVRHVYQMYSLRVLDGQRERMLRCLWASGINANIHFDPPIHRQPWYAERDFRSIELPVTERLSGEILTLPIFPSMTRDDIHTVAAVVRKVLI
ncbi:aminotransferase class I/II-fold pyridoxal phosphate-dependent enzyme [Duganella sp. FT50W]|uniref:Aminotransferase class I/II-fold pyridoxal phosphate-dependent enzyme n=1 Tax=Duganella lactea TaxID=2692173 RepID=A0A6L8MIK3_9BURK|nr:DegT/DnrJ/EryC1/StrS family aminotransferase [Duganella lactea]MYM82960.1 aminotransferase class I/II-fold pyridoxal phosphate-dependent enzyme [Duganella lactea]